MWLNVKWYDASNALLREDGEYGDLSVTTPGVPAKVKTLLNPASTKVYEAHYGMTQGWAKQLLDLGYAAGTPLSFDRVTGGVSYTLGQLAAQAPDTSHETFHFVLNNTVIKDNRIPTYGMSYDSAKERNALPVPAAQYGSPTTNGTYNYWDNVALAPPAGATYATIELKYQSTSWEYIQFLYLANNGSNAFLANEGVNLLNAWLNTGMAEPVVMASTTWGSGGPTPICTAPTAPQNLKATAGKKTITLNWTASASVPNGGYRVHYDQAGKIQFRGAVSPSTLTYKDTGLTSRQSYTYVATAWNDCNGNNIFDAGVDTESPISNPISATAQ